MLWELCILIFTLAFLLFTFFSILYLLQLRRTARNFELVLDTLQQSLPSIMAKLNSAASELSEAAHIIKSQLYGLSTSIRKVDGMVDEIVDFERAIRKDIELPVMQILSTYRALARGVQAFIATFLSRS